MVGADSAAAAAGRSTGRVSGAGAGRGASDGSGMTPVERTTRCAGATGSGASSPTAGATGATTCGASGAPPTTAGTVSGPDSGWGSGAAFSRVLGSAAFFGSGFDGSSSTIGSRRSPSESARRRTRSASGSSMLDEWLFTPIFSRSHRSSTT